METTYRISFKGRYNTAIGALSCFEQIISAKNKDEAIMKLYESYEHITIIEISELYKRIKDDK